MASPFDRLMDTIRPHLPGAVDNAIRQELFGTCRTFFDKTNVWQEDLDFIVAAGDTEADILPFTGMIIRLLSVVDSNGQPFPGVICTDTVNGVLQLPSTMTAGTYTAKVAITVSDPISRDAFPIVPNDLVTKHWQTIMYGILSNMMMQPSKPYTNLPLAQAYMVRFNGSSNRAKNSNDAGNTKGSQNWQYPQTWNRRN